VLEVLGPNQVRNYCFFKRMHMLILPTNEYANSALLTIMNVESGLVKICHKEVDTARSAATLCGVTV
jgi:hypothetical protein